MADEGSPFDDFNWSQDAYPTPGAEYTLLPHRIRIMPVSDEIVGCDVCAARRYREIDCFDQAACDSATLVPIEDAVVVAMMASLRLRGLRHFPFETEERPLPVIHIHEVKP
jgi:hypothetical protein